nr:GTP-binding nuclear protein Ran-3-like [Tanacetum cinerariifolium]
MVQRPRGFLIDGKAAAIATIEVELHPLDFFTNHMRIRFYCWDWRAKGSIGVLMRVIVITSMVNGAIIMFDFTSRVTYDNIPNWHPDLCRLCKVILIVLCGNKVESKKRVVKAKNIGFHKKNNLEYAQNTRRCWKCLFCPWLRYF